MSFDRLWSRDSRRLALLLLLVAGVPAIALVWLGVQLVVQDRALAGQRLLERRQAAVQGVVLSLERTLADVERRAAANPVPDGMLRVTITRDRITAEPRNRILWLPHGSSSAEASDEGTFHDVERREYGGEVQAALLEYERLARTGDRVTKAGALVRIARLHRTAERWNAAIEAYRRLGTFGDVAVAGAPADLQARRAMCAVLDAARRTADRTREAHALGADLVGGRWDLDRPAWELAAADVERWTGSPVRVSAEQRLFSEALEALRATSARESSAMPSRALVYADGTALTVLADRRDGSTVFLVVSPGVVSAWTRQAVAGVPVDRGSVVLMDPSGRALEGPSTSPGKPAAKATASETGLPWSIAFFDDGSGIELSAGRRWLLSSGLAAILLFAAGGSYLLWRVVRRELAVSRLQADFVAAVSHEFRTPLTSLRHVTELLDESDEVPPARRGALYGALGRNVERLHRLVESLLDFSRMEDCRKPYDMRPIDAAELATEVVREFRAEVASQGFVVEFDADRSAPLVVNADDSAVTHALWNLLDNAVKYSADTRRIQVVIGRADGSVAMSVIDHGVGVPPREQSEIFQKFVRGERARRLGIKGTGLGLAMVSHIARAHRGAVTLDSVEGVGSTFTLTLPAAADAVHAPASTLGPVPTLQDHQR